MPRTRDELRAELKTEAERLIDELVAWSDQVNAPTLTDIEDQVLKVRKAFGEKLADALVEKQPTVEPLTWSRPGAERMLPIRTAILSHAFDAWWQHASAMPLN